jgi:hypothetical protein
MANTTFNGPVRSQNGFQEWNGTAWVPVAGGGGATEIFLGDQYSPNFFGNPDNRYSDSQNSVPPTGPTAGTIIQLPQIAVGQSYRIRSDSGSGSGYTWAIQLPSIPGTDMSAFFEPVCAANYVYDSVYNSDLDVYTYTPAVFYFSIGTVGETPLDTMYLYGAPQIWAPLEITRLPDVTVPGFGMVALFNQSATPTFKYQYPLPDWFVYPYTQLLPAP